MLLSLFTIFCLTNRALTDTFQAETGTLIGVTVTTSTSGYYGSSYVTSFDAETDSVTVAPYGDKKASLVVNGAVTGEITLASCASFCTVSAVTVALGTGSIGVGLKSNRGYYEVDESTITYISSSGGGTLSSSPIDSQATQGAKALLKYIQKQYDVNYLSGQQDPTSLVWVVQNVGKTPATLGTDFTEYSPSRVAYATSTAVEDAIAFDARGGVNTFVWHWNAPTGLINTSGKEWWRGFYTDSTTFDVVVALNEGTSGTNYKLLLRDIDAIAVQIARLYAANVPILFPTLHEPKGGWFLWGAKGSAAFKTL